MWNSVPVSFVVVEQTEVFCFILKAIAHAMDLMVYAVGEKKCILFSCMAMYIDILMYVHATKSTFLHNMIIIES